MKLSSIILMITILSVGATVYSQTTYLNAQMKDVTVKEVFKKIEDQSQFRFFYSDDLNYINKRVNINATHKTVEKILDEVLKDSDLTYKILENNLIIIVPSDMVQGIRITGVVKDDLGEPMPGVNVVVKGTSIGVVTGINGDFSINVPDANSILAFSFIGYLTQEITVGTQRNISVDMKEDATQLEEVVVVGAGLRKEQKAIGYAISSISAKEINKVGAQNLGAALYGKASGVQIRSAPGGSTSAVSINIRGISSLNYSTQPLVIVDGIPIRSGDAQTGRLWGGERIEQNGIVDINPEDIENISILKGAAASALYGSEATNGVVVISTKGGQTKQGVGVDVNISHTWDRLAFAPKYQNIYGPGYPESYGIVYDDNGFYHSTVNGQDVAYPHWRAYGNFGPKMEGQNVMWWDGQYRPYNPQPDNYKDVFQNGYTSSYNFAISNAGQLGNYRLSYTRNQNKGIQYGSDNYKNTISFNTHLNISKFLTADVVVNYFNGNVHNRPLTLNFLNGFSYSRGDDIALSRQHYKDPDGYKYTWTPSDSPEYYLPVSTRSDGVMDYLWTQLENSRDEKLDRLIGSVTLNFTFTDWLNMRARVGTDFSNIATEAKEKNTRPSYINRNTGRFETRIERAGIQYGDLLLTANRRVADDWNLSLTLGGTYKHQYINNQAEWTDGGLDKENWFSLNNSINPIKGEYTRKLLSKGGAFGILGVNYKEMLFLEATGRYEQVSTLPPAGNKFFYPSASASFVFSQLWDMPSWWDFGKIRASYGVVGNEPDIYAANNAYSASTVNGVTKYSFSGDYGNDEIKPEKKHEYEIGLENKFFNHRLSLELTYYYSRILNQIVQLDVPRSSGVSRMLTNLAELRNTGFEVSINARPVIAGKFSWDTRLNLGFNKNKVVKLPEGMDRLMLQDEGGYAAIQIMAVPGRPMGDIYALHHMLNDKGQKLVDDDGYWIRGDNYTHMGNSTPWGMGGWGNTLNYGNFYVDFLIDMRFGGQMFSFTNYYGLCTGRLEKSLEYRTEADGGLPYYVDATTQKKVRLSSHNDAAPAGSTGKVYHDGVIVEGVTSDGNTNETIIRAEDYYGNHFDWGPPGLYGKAVYDNSYIKFREMSIGYNFNPALTKRIGLQNLSISLIARNLFYIWKTIPNIDPEAAIGTNAARMGIEPGGSQPIRSIGFMLRTSF